MPGCLLTKFTFLRSSKKIGNEEGDEEEVHLFDDNDVDSSSIDHSTISPKSSKSGDLCDINSKLSFFLLLTKK